MLNNLLLYNKQMIPSVCGGVGPKYRGTHTVLAFFYFETRWQGMLLCSLEPLSFMSTFSNENKGKTPNCQFTQSLQRQEVINEVPLFSEIIKS